MTLRAYPSTVAASAAITDRTGFCSPEAVEVESATPKPPSMTLASERFIAFVIMRVRINPDAPTNDPAMISMLLSSTKPAAAAARPE